MNKQRITDFLAGAIVAGTATIIAITALILALLPLDLRMQNRAIQQANLIANTSWTKVSAKPLVSRFYPNGWGAYVVRLRSENPTIPDQSIMVVDDDERGKELLAIPDGCSVKATRNESRRWRSRSMAYNYLIFSCKTLLGKKSGEL